MVEQLILASGSQIRAQLLSNANVKFQVVPAKTDENTIKNQMMKEGADAPTLAEALATAKAKEVAKDHPNALVLGCDQLLEMDGTIYSKPTSPAEAASHLASFSGKAHHLISSAVIAQGDQILWRSTDEVHMHVHDLTPRFIEGYVTRNWDEIRHCVGCYQLEAEGVRLFQRIDGDYFTVLGMPLLDVLSYLRSRGTLDG